ncbi:MAG: beta-ketoacyl-[acyl-carrier-protein] synthase family protein [Pseudomonadota bacterium]
MTAYFIDKNWDKKESERKRVVITGLGAVTPIGNSVNESWQNLVKGKSGIGPITIFKSSTYPVKIGAEVKNFDFDSCVPEEMSPFLGRSTKFCVHAAQEALEHAGLDLQKMDTANIGIALGANEEGSNLSLFEKMFDVKAVKEHLEMRKTSPEYSRFRYLEASKQLGQIWPFRRSAYMAANILSILFNIQGPVSTSSGACASSAQAIGRAMRMIQDGDAEVMLTGGCDSMIGEFFVTGFHRLRALSRNNDNPEKASRPFDLKRDGFILGEGSGILVLEDLSHARKRNATIYGELIGYGSSANANSIAAPPEDGSGADICMKAALKDARCSTDDVDYINAHGTSTYLNDKSETAAIKNVFQDRAYEIPVSSNKSMLGHLVASAASIELIMSVLTINKKIIPPTINYENPDPECDLDYVPNERREKKVETILSNSFAFGGQNASVLVKKFQ